jgi:hypothetical protein
MAAASSVPSLSQIRMWDVDHLVNAATTWRSTADQWQESFSLVANHMPAPGGTPWEGPSGAAAQLRANADAIEVGEIADILRNVSSVASNGADKVDAARRAALDAVERAESAGFAVGEDLSVKSKYTDLTLEAEAARQAQAETLAADIHTKAIALAAADQEVAEKITSAASGIHVAPLSEDVSHNSHRATTEGEPVILTAGWQPAKQAPADGIDPPPPAPPARGLPPEGVSPPVSGKVTPGPASRPSEQRRGGQSLWDEKGGEWRYFPGDNYHNPHWDYNPHNLPKATPWQNVPIDNLPPVKGGPAPAEAPPPRPAVPVQPPAEAPPVRGGSSGGVPLGGGPLPDNSLPHPVELPGAGDPDLPVLGDGKADLPEA